MTQTTQPQPTDQSIPGLTGTTTAALIGDLRAQPQRPLEFWLNGEVLVPAGYHVTEVKAVTIEAMDCGGQANLWRETVIQLMDGTAAEAQAGFMTNRKFLAIYDRVVRHIPVRDGAELRFEYGNDRAPALQYHVSHLESRPERLIMHLRTPGVQCKAGELCGLPAPDSTDSTDSTDACEPGSGCCGPQAPISLG